MPRIRPPSLTVNAISASGEHLYFKAITQLEIDCGNGVHLRLGSACAPVAPACNLTVQKAVSKQDKAFTPKKKQIRKWVEAALQGPADITVRFVNAEEGKTLNQQFRGKDCPTNVLSFVYDAPVAHAESAAHPILGDLVLCVPVVVREAAEQDKLLEAHYAHLIVHGALHLQGYDHENRSEAKAMEAIERRILATLGYADPYVA